MYFILTMFNEARGKTSWLLFCGSAMEGNA